MMDSIFVFTVQDVVVGLFVLTGVLIATAVAFGEWRRNKRGGK